MYATTKPYVSQIKELIRSTWRNNPFVEVVEGSSYNLFHARGAWWADVDHTDGFGTKGLIHWQRRTLAAAAQDAIAMNVNDLVAVGAVPYKTQVHLMLPEDDHAAILDTMKALVELCVQQNIAITGGETSVQDNLKGMEISLTMTGAVVHRDQVRNEIREGNVILGIPSSGIHANGFTLVRKLVHDYVSHPELATPTRIYSLPVPCQSAIHITGGGWDRLRRILPGGLAANLVRWQLPPLYVWLKGLYEDVVSRDISGLYRTLNMGYGMVIIAKKDEADQAQKVLGADVLGEVVQGANLVRIGSGKNELIL
jgi:phosphoribosylformylglycinamidine cyclo-ligase